MIWAIVIVAIIAVILIVRRNRQRQIQQMAALQQQSQQTTGSGFIGYLTNLFNKNQTGSGTMSENEAKAISQKIADYYETETEEGKKQAETLIQELYSNGWQYIGYNQVELVA